MLKKWLWDRDRLPAQVLILAGHQSPAILTPDRGGQESLHGKLGLWKAIITTVAGSSQVEWTRLHIPPYLQPNELPSTALPQPHISVILSVKTARQEKLPRSTLWGQGCSSLAVPSPCPPSSQCWQREMDDKAHTLPPLPLPFPRPLLHNNW